MVDEHMKKVLHVQYGGKGCGEFQYSIMEQGVRSREISLSGIRANKFNYGGVI